MDQSPALTGDVLHIKYVPVDVSKRWDRNPKKHDFDALVTSIVRHGFRDAPIYDGTLDAIAAGNGRTTAVAFIRDNPEKARAICQKAGVEWDGNPPAGVAVDSAGGWFLPMQFGVDAKSKAAAEAFAVAHNNLTMSGGDFSFLDVAQMWDEGAYATLLTELADAGEMPVGVSDQDVSDFLGMLDGIEGDGSDGSLLALLDVVIAEPRHTVNSDEVWKLGPHVLLCVDVMFGWDAWAKHLEGSAIFCPYPGPLVALTSKAQEHKLVLVQPDPYIAGHIVDRYADMNGEHSVERVD